MFVKWHSVFFAYIFLRFFFVRMFHAPSTHNVVHYSQLLSDKINPLKHVTPRIRLCSVMLLDYEEYTFEHWISYHLLIGFDEIWIYIDDKNLTNAHREKIERIDQETGERIQLKMLSDLKTTRYTQGKAFKHCYKNAGSVDWIAQCDGDEYFYAGAPFREKTTFLWGKSELNVKEYLLKYIGDSDVITVYRQFMVSATVNGVFHGYNESKKTPYFEGRRFKYVLDKNMTNMDRNGKYFIKTGLDATKINLLQHTVEKRKGYKGAALQLRHKYITNPNDLRIITYETRSIEECVLKREKKVGQWGPQKKRHSDDCESKSLSEEIHDYSLYRYHLVVREMSTWLGLATSGHRLQQWNFANIKNEETRIQNIPRQKSTEKRQRVRLCAVMLLDYELLTIRHWIAYHLFVGFKDIVIYIDDKNLTFHHEHAIKLMDHAYPQVTFVYLEDRFPRQRHIYQDCYERSSPDEFDWVAQCDGDEYYYAGPSAASLSEVNGSYIFDIGETLRPFTKYQGITVYRKTYVCGTSGTKFFGYEKAQQKTYFEGKKTNYVLDVVTSNYKQGKYILKTGLNTSKLVWIENGAHFVQSDGSFRLKMLHFWWTNNDFANSHQISHFSDLHIKHYDSRSKEECKLKKLDSFNRSRGTWSGTKTWTRRQHELCDKVIPAAVDPVQDFSLYTFASKIRKMAQKSMEKWNILHIPKTAGSSVVRDLEKITTVGVRIYHRYPRLMAKELPYKYIRNLSGKTFTMFRNPVTHLMSLFLQCKYGKWGIEVTNGTSFPRVMNETTGGFSTWVDHFLNGPFLNDFNCYNPWNMQTRYLTMAYNKSRGYLQAHHLFENIPKEPNEKDGYDVLRDIESFGMKEFYRETLCLYHYYVYNNVHATCRCQQFNETREMHGLPRDRDINPTVWRQAMHLIRRDVRVFFKAREIFFQRMKDFTSKTGVDLTCHRQKKKFMAFKHMSKCAGTTLKRLVEQGVYPARMISEYEPLRENNTDGLFVISSVRNPYAYYQSLWGFHHTKKWAYKKKYKLLYDHTSDIPCNQTIFNNWLSAVKGVMSTRFQNYAALGRMGSCWKQKIYKNCSQPITMKPKDLFKHVDCWVKVENISGDIQKCLKTYQQNFGSSLINWEYLHNFTKNGTLVYRRNPSKHCSLLDLYRNNSFAQKIIQEHDGIIFKAFNYSFDVVG